MYRRRLAPLPPRHPERCVVFNARCHPTAVLTPTAPKPTGMDALVPGQAVPLIWEPVWDDQSCGC